MQNLTLTIATSSLTIGLSGHKEAWCTLTTCIFCQFPARETRTFSVLITQSILTVITYYLSPLDNRSFRGMD